MTRRRQVPDTGPVRWRCECGALNLGTLDVPCGVCATIHSSRREKAAPMVIAKALPVPIAKLVLVKTVAAPIPTPAFSAPVQPAVPIVRHCALCGDVMTQPRARRCAKCKASISKRRRKGVKRSPEQWREHRNTMAQKWRSKHAERLSVQATARRRTRWLRYFAAFPEQAAFFAEDEGWLKEYPELAAYLPGAEPMAVAQ